MTEQLAGQSWPQIDDIVVNHGEGAPSPCDPPAGTFILTAAGGEATLVLAGREATLTEEGVEEVQSVDYYAVTPDLYLVDVTNAAPGTARMFVLDTAQRRALQIEAVAPLPDIPDNLLERVALRGSQSAVGVAYRHLFATPATGVAFPRTSRLAGKQYRYVYSSTHEYDHFYVNDRYYAWFCLRGPDQGLGDFEECDHFALTDDIVLFVWKEKLLPCVGITVEDHSLMRSVGKIFGANSGTGEAQGVIVGADIRLIADISGE